MAETKNPPQTQRRWPPTQRIRDAVIQRLIESQSSPFIFSKRYGTVPVEEASDIAKRIEEDVFIYAGSSSSLENDGIDILTVYSKEITKRMLDTAKARSTATTASTETESKPSELLVDASEQTSSAAPTEEVSSVATVS